MNFGFDCDIQKKKNEGYQCELYSETVQICLHKKKYGVHILRFNSENSLKSLTQNGISIPHRKFQHSILIRKCLKIGGTDLTFGGFKVL